MGAPRDRARRRTMIATLIRRPRGDAPSDARAYTPPRSTIGRIRLGRAERGNRLFGANPGTANQVARACASPSANPVGPEDEEMYWGPPGGLSRICAPGR